MEKINLGYSLKNIPVPSKDSYTKNMLGMVENFLRRVRWKAHWFNQETTATEYNTYGFGSENVPSADQHLTNFENDMYDMVHSLKFRTIRNPFLNKLSSDARTINNSKEVYVPADKTTNLYKLPPQDYKKLLHDNITAKYKKTNIQQQTRIDREAKKIAGNLGLDDRIEQYAKNNAFITLKDHKENFENNPKCRLLNPAKSEIGIISRHLLQRINNELRNTLPVRQWKNSSDVIAFFEGAEKTGCKFVQFDIVEFYPSITERLLSDALNFARQHVNITSKEIDTIQHARKSLLFTDDKPWIKRDGTLFDVTMGSYDGAEVCDLIGLYLLTGLKQKFENLDMGLYRDDGLGIYKNLPGPEAERTKKKIIQHFNANGLQITIDFNMTRVNFLDATFDINNGKYCPYRKPNDNPLYIHKDSNHPLSITKQLPAMIQRRISDISSDVNEFDKAKDIYNKALKDSGYRDEITYTNTPTQRRRTRRRKIIWFNPPYNKAVETNIGKKFIAIIKKHFTRRHKYHKIFNTNTLKISYSCTPNMKSIITKHNKKLLSQPTATDDARKCNCPREVTCPLNGNCLAKAIVYRGEVVSETETKEYTGLTEPKWKSRFANHLSSFRNAEKKNSTSLAKYIWDLKDKNIPYEIKWTLHKQAFPYKCGTRKCDLCPPMSIITSAIIDIGASAYLKYIQISKNVFLFFMLVYWF